MSYNGWKNYETWNVALWLDNDEGSYAWAREEAQNYLDENPDSANDAAHQLARMLEEAHDDWNPLSDQPSTFCDLLGAALQEVDWFEIAEHLVREVAEV